MAASFVCILAALMHKGALHIWSSGTRGLLIPAEELSSLWYRHGGVLSTNTQGFYPPQLQNSTSILLLLGTD